MIDDKMVELDNTIAEQNRLMNGKPFEFTEEEMAEGDKFMGEFIEKCKEKKQANKQVRTA